MALVPFRLTLAPGPLDNGAIAARLAEWVAATHGPTGRVVRWAVVAGPDGGSDGPWQLEGVAGPMPE